MSLELLGMIGGLALLDMLSPATLGVTVYLLLSEKERIGSRLMIYLGTVAGFYFSAGFVLMLGLDALLSAFSSILENRFISWTMMVIGAALFTASFFYPKGKKRTDLPRPKSKSKASMVALGFTTFLIEVGMAFPYFAAVGLMTTRNLPVYQWLPILGGYNFMMILPPLVLFVLHVLLGRFMQRPLERLRIKLSNTGSALSWIMCIVGLILMLNSVDNL
ncbi:GAP family protein [Paenibacillus motobuensis]|uniref:Sap, sulfolipid-1-addressing protein n=1 Tax=Paenibacillus motobuensis TaxID=295324 RepID=A0ABN0YKX6_9BACL